MWPWHHRYGYRNPGNGAFGTFDTPAGLVFARAEIEDGTVNKTFLPFPSAKLFSLKSPKWRVTQKLNSYSIRGTKGLVRQLPLVGDMTGHGRKPLQRIIDKMLKQACPEGILNQVQNDTFRFSMTFCMFC